ncbi:MAG: glycoside hydrolase family 2 TIM barrel-domain containing protein [Armatimonadota bacterium]|nr:glycoside hydrolase family 2 TIM barrel-domain containing protein [Armatimonadota bacterium]
MAVSAESPYVTNRTPLADGGSMRSLVWLNGEWDFAPQSEYAAPKVGEWSSVKIRIPSPWNVNSFSGGNGPGGDFVTFSAYPREWESAPYGWHKRQFTLTNGQLAEKRVILHFEAVMYEAEVYVNGRLAGRHGDGFLPFEFDVTDLVIPGANEVMVGVRNADHIRENGRATHPTGSFWGEHVRGIWQDVYLRLLPDTYITDIYVTTSVREKKLNAEVTVTNSSRERRAFAVSFSVQPAIGAGGSIPKIPVQQVTLEPGETKVAPASALWESPKLWSPESPFLYYMTVSLSSDKPLDETAVRFGFREFWIAGTHLILNGNAVRTNGDAWHFMGVPQMTEEYARAWYQAAKEANVGIVRPHAQVYPRFYLDVADEVGMLIIDENATWASHCNYQYTPGFWTRAARHAEDWVKRDRNHPSIVIWSVDNEIFGAHMANPNDGAPSMEWLIQQVDTQLVPAIRKYDKSRPISADGDNDHEGALPICCMHYPGADPPEAKYRGKPVTIGEVGPMYYCGPDQPARFIGDVVYESFGNRLKGIGIEMNWVTQKEREWAEYTAPFNLVWYALDPLPFAGQTWSYSDLDGPGMKPDRIGPYTSTLNAGFDPNKPLYQPNAFYPYMRDSFLPQRFFFNERNAGFYAGQSVKRSVTVHNDVMRAVDMRLDISVTCGGADVYSKSTTLKMPAAGMETISFSFGAPQVKQRTEMDVFVCISEKDRRLFEQAQKCSVFPGRVTAPRVSILESAKTNISSVLAAAGIDATPVKSSREAAADRPLLISVNRAMSDDEKAALMAKVNEGLRVVFFGAVPWNELSWKEKAESADYAFPADPNHPIFQGMRNTDLALWAGDGPSVVGWVYQSIPPPNARALLFCGNGQIAIYEQRVGKGRIIGCGIDMGKASAEPAARMLLANLANYAATAPDASAANAPTSYIGAADSMLAKTLNALGVERSEDAAAAGSKMVIIDGSEPLPDTVKPGALRKVAEDGGKILIWGLKLAATDSINRALGLSISLTESPRDVLVKCDRGLPVSGKGFPETTTPNGLTFVEGILEARPNKSSYIRQDVLHPSPSDVNVSKEAIAAFGLKTGDTVAGWARPPARGEQYFSLVTVESVNGNGRADPLLVGINNADLYWLEPHAGRNVIEQSVEVADGQVLIKSPGINWHGWTDNGENIKTSAVIKSQANPAPTANALVRLPYEKGEIILCQITARPTSEKIKRVAGSLLENLGVPMTRERPAGFVSGADDEGFIRTWLISGPHSSPERNGNDLAHDWLGDELTAAPQAGDKWKKHANVVEAGIDFHAADLFPDQNEAAAYAAVYVWSPKNCGALLDSPDVFKADLRVGSDDGIKVWLNGKEVWSNPAMRPLGPDQDVIHNVVLRCGWNLLMMKIGQGTGGWGTMARFTDPGGKPIEELKYSAEKPGEYGK